MSDEIESKKREIERKYNDIQRRINLKELQSKLTDTATDIAELPERIAGLRSRGYAFANYLEGKSETLAKQWDEIREQANATIREQAHDLRNDFDEVVEKYTKMDAASGLAAQTYINQLEPSLESMEERIDAAEDSVKSAFGKVPDNVGQTSRQIDTIEKYLDLSDEASFSLNSAEAIFMAVDAEWEKTGKDKKDPDGIFYITDQRIVMEQKEKVGKNFLGFGGEEVQEILWEAPIHTIQEIDHENKGLLGGIDLIHITFEAGSGAPMAKTTIEVKGGIEAKWFAGQLKRAAGGDLERERGLELEQSVVEAIADAPTTCAVCGADFDQPLRQGLNELKCQYCGATTRLAI